MSSWSAWHSWLNAAAAAGGGAKDEEQPTTHSATPSLASPLEGASVWIPAAARVPKNSAPGPSKDRETEADEEQEQEGESEASGAAPSSGDGQQADEQEQPAPDAAAAEDDADEDDEEDDDDECAFCAYMKGGGCKREFVKWSKCIDEAKAADDPEFPLRCAKYTDALQGCMAKPENAEYYRDLLEGEADATEALQSEAKEHPDASMHVDTKEE